ncbi:bifunctional N-acetylglucosamine-1-phosphate uridyltransferase/glucosamine-1-phosphate acetyltransferase [Candidatus Auribacterota bacterium]
MTVKKIRALILAAGQGKRMKSDFPKVLHSLKGRSLVDYVIDAVQSAGVDEISMVVGHKKECFKEFTQKGITLVEQKKLLGSGHAVMQAEKDCQQAGHILVLCGDVPLIQAKTLKKLVKKHLAAEASATVLTGILDDPKNYGRVVKDNKNSVIAIVEEKDATPSQRKIREINSGIYCFKSKDLFSALKKIKQENKQNEYYLTAVIQILSKEQKKVEAVLVEEIVEIQGINNRKDLTLLETILNQKIVEQLMAEGITIIDPKTTFINSRVKIGKDTTIMPFTVIEEDVKIGKRCKIGPFSHLRKGTVLDDEVEIGNFVEVKKSWIKTKTKAKHLSYIGDSILGKKVNIGAGTITANYDGKNKHQTIVGDEAFIGSDTKLIAPVKVGKKAITGAGSVVTKDISPGSVVVGVPARKIR